MIEAKSIKITNAQRLQKRKSGRDNKFKHMTPEKFFDTQSTYKTVNRLEKKFGYDYDFEQSQPLKYMKEEFLNRTLDYLGKGEWTKKMGRKDKYEMNIELGRPLKKNPLQKIFGRIEHNMNVGKQESFEIIKRRFGKQKKRGLKFQFRR